MSQHVHDPCGQAGRPAIRSPSSSTSTPGALLRSRRRHRRGHPPVLGVARRRLREGRRSSPRTRDGSIVGYGDIGETGDAVWLDVRAFERRAAARVARDARSGSRTRRSPARASWGSWRRRTPASAASTRRRGYQVIRHSYRMEIELRDLAAGAPCRRKESSSARCARARRSRSTRCTSSRSRTHGCTRASPSSSGSTGSSRTRRSTVALVRRRSRRRARRRVDLSTRGRPSPASGWVRVLGVLRSHRRRGHRRGASPPHLRRVQAPRIRASRPRCRRREPDRRRRALRAGGHARGPDEPAAGKASGIIGAPWPSHA